MFSKNISPVVLALGLIFSNPVVAEEDQRTLIKIAPESQALMLTEMRVLLDNIDDLLAALSEGEFGEVAKIADYKLGFGHAKFEKMFEDGVPEAEIEARRVKMMKRRASGQGGHGNGGGSSIFGEGLGRLMPEEVREMGQQLHAAAAEVSVAAKKAGATPTVDDYKAVLEAVQQMTSNCRACHSSFRIR